MVSDIDTPSKLVTWWVHHLAIQLAVLLMMIKYTAAPCTQICMSSQADSGSITHMAFYLHHLYQHFLLPTLSDSVGSWLSQLHTSSISYWFQNPSIGSCYLESKLIKPLHTILWRSVSLNKHHLNASSIGPQFQCHETLALSVQITISILLDWLYTLRSHESRLYARDSNL